MVGVGRGWMNARADERDMGAHSSLASMVLIPLDSPWVTLTAAILLGFTLALWRMYLVKEQRRREAENADKASLFHHSVDAVAAVDEAGLIKRTNGALAELTGFPPEALRERCGARHPRSAVGCGTRAARDRPRKAEAARDDDPVRGWSDRRGGGE